jgi:hypothetical protein
MKWRVYSLIFFPGALLGGPSAKSGPTDSEPLDLGKFVLIPETPAWNWTRVVSPGVGLTRVGRVKFSGGSLAAGAMYPSFVGSNSLIEPPVGTLGAIGPRIYNDGFVDLDAGTVNDGRTWNWGYQTPGQVGNDTLTFHAPGSQSIRTDFPTSTSSLHQTETVAAAQFHLDFHLFPDHGDRPPRIQSGWMLSISGLGFDDDYSYSDFSLRQRRDDFRLDYTDVFQLNGVIPPTAPFTGTRAGPGPVIPNQPAGRTVDPVLINRTEATFTNQVDTSYDVTIISVGIGPAWRYNAEDNLSWELAAGVSFNLFNWSADQREVVSVTGQAAPVRSWSHHRSGLDMNVGAFVRGSVHHQLSENWHTSIFLQAHAASDLSFGTGPSSLELEHDGFTMGWALGVGF